MQKFLVLYMMPYEGLQEWMKKPESERKDADMKMRKEWDEWMAKNGKMLKDTGAIGPIKRVTKDGVMDGHNDIMLYSIAQGESAEAVAEAFKDHPHFGIPNASIEVMPMREIQPM